jgi:hypothetical protein
MANNNFPDGSWQIFQDAWTCWYCGMNTADCLHHIVGRGNGDSVVESSILNAAPMCNHKCHIPNHGKLKRAENIRELLRTTYIYLITYGYKLNDNDEEFRKKYAKYYKKENS